MEPPSPGPQAPAKLERIGRYRIIRPLSKGGMALVYEARRESLAGVSPRVAVKVILPEYTDSDTFQELFINEARLGASMQHQNLVQIQDFDRDGDRFFLVMEYVEGVTLRRSVSLCRRHGVRVPLGVIAEIGRQACDGLHYAHAAADEHGEPLHLVHRDVKPSNLILNPHGVVKLLDFGISKGRLLREKKGAVKGTWGYMAPEQAFGKDVGPRADVFGLATVLYELAALDVLFEGKNKTRIKRLLMDDHAARMAATLDADVYGPLIPVLVRALQRDPAARYDNAADFGRHLSALLPDPITARDEVVSFFKLVRALDEGVPVEQAARSAEFRSEPSASPGSLVIPSQPPESSPQSTLGPVPVWAVGGMAGFALLLVVVLGSVALWQGEWLADPLAGDAGDGASMADVIRSDEAVEATAEPAADEPPGPAGEDAPGEQTPPPVASRTLPQERPPPDETVPLPVRTVDPPPEPAAGTAEPEPAVSKPVSSERIVVVRKKADEGGAAQPAGADEEPGLLTIGAKQPAEVYVDGNYVRMAPLYQREYDPGTHVVSIQAVDGRTKTFEVVLEPGEEERWIWDFDRGEWR